MKLIPGIFLTTLGLAAGAIAADEPAAPQAPSPKAMEQMRAACQADVAKLCPGVQPGGGRILACLKEHKDEVSASCKQAIVSARQKSS